MAEFPTAIPSQPVRNEQSMAGRGDTGTEHLDEHEAIYGELIAICEAIGIPGSGGALATRLRDLEFARGLTATLSNIAAGASPYTVTIATSNPAFAALSGQAPNLALAQRTAGGLPGTWPVAVTYDAPGTSYVITLPGPGTWSVTLKVV